MVPTFIGNVEEVTINVKPREYPPDDTTLTNHEARLTQVRTKLVQLLQQVHCEALRKEKNCYGMGSGVEGMSGGWKKIIINNRDLYACLVRHKPCLAKTNFASQAWLH